jgi:hypothetical protein
MPNFRWTERTVEAAALVAKDELTNQEIAGKVGVTPQALGKWKANPEFMARVDGHIAEFAETIRRRGIAQLGRRVDALNDRWNRMRRVIESRAEAYADDMHGGDTGLICRTVKWERKWNEERKENESVPVYEYEVDTGLLRELREHEKQAAQELGQWTEKKELSGHGGGPIPIGIDLSGLSDDELGVLRKITSLPGKPDAMASE